MDTNKHQELLYKDLSYQIQGAAIEVRKNFGSGHKESIYQNALAEELRFRKINFEKEKNIKIYSPKTGVVIGYYKPDFIIEDKIIIELKAVEKIPRMFLDQLYDLRNSKYELGYFINFASPKLYIKRIIFTNDRKFLKNLVILSLLLVLFSVLPTYAAEVSIISESHKIAVGDQFQVDVTLNTQGDSVNALEGVIKFSKNILNLKEIRSGNSIINFWIEQPRVETLKNTNKNTNSHEEISGTSCSDSCSFVSFSGITPGGYNGANGLLFSLVIEGAQESDGLVAIQSLKILKNDGQGTEIKTKFSNLEIAVLENISGSKSHISKLEDKTSPEPFSILISRDPSLFDGKYFAIFATQDKGAGVDRYEILETRNPLCFMFHVSCAAFSASDSPYLLRDQKLFSFVYVKAVDKAGNERMTKIWPYRLTLYGKYLIWIIIIGLGILFGWFLL